MRPPGAFHDPPGAVRYAQDTELDIRHRRWPARADRGSPRGLVAHRPGPLARLAGETMLRKRDDRGTSMATPGRQDRGRQSSRSRAIGLRPRMAWPSGTANLPGSLVCAKRPEPGRDRCVTRRRQLRNQLRTEQHHPGGACGIRPGVCRIASRACVVPSAGDHDRAEVPEALTGRLAAHTEHPGNLGVRGPSAQRLRHQALNSDPMRRDLPFTPGDLLTPTDVRVPRCHLDHLRWPTVHSPFHVRDRCRAWCRWRWVLELAQPDDGPTVLHRPPCCPVR
jgi:hypothetical protein